MAGYRKSNKVSQKWKVQIVYATAFTFIPQTDTFLQDAVQRRAMIFNPFPDNLRIL